MSQIVWEVIVETDTLPPSTPPVPVTFAIYAGTPGKDGTGGTSAVISPSTPTQSLTANYLLRVSADGTHVDQLNPNTFDASGTAATSMAAHIANLDPHTQYALDADLAGYSVVGHTHAASAIVSGTLNDARLSSNVAMLNAANTFTTTQTVSKLLVPPQVTGATNPLTIRANTGGAFTEPIFYVGLQGSETSSGIAVRSNGAIQLLGGAAVGQFNDIQLGGAGTAAFGIARGSAQSFNLGGTGIFTFDAGSSGTSFDLIHSAKTSTTAGRTAGRTLYSWSNSTDATRSGQVEEYVGTYSGNVRIARRFAESLNPFHALSISATAPTDGALQASEVAFYTDSSALFAKLKNASGTVYTINLAGSGGSGGAAFSGPINYPVASPTSFGVNVSDYGATGNGTTDDTAAIQAALTAGAGGVVYLPAGEYVLNSSTLAIPANTTLQGTYGGSQSHSGYRDGSPLPTVGGSRLLVKQSSTAAVSLTHNSTLDGVCFYYPDQVQLTAPPTAYPATVKMRGNNPTVRNCELLNSYIGIDINNTSNTNSTITQRPTVENVTGQPLYRGITMGLANDDASTTGWRGILDCARFVNVHFNPWWSFAQPGTSIPDTLYLWQLANGYAFEIGDCDEFVMTGCFAYGYNRFLSLSSPSRGSYGSITGGGSDLCVSGIYATGTQQQGIRVTGVGFAVPSGGGAAINVSAGGSILAQACNFWSLNPAIACSGGRVSAVGCDFQVAGTQVTQSSTGKVNVVGGFANGGLGTSGTVSSTGVVTY